MTNIVSGNSLAEVAALIGDPARANILQALQSSVVRPGPGERFQLRHRLASIGNHQRLALTDSLQVPSEPGLQFAGTNPRMGHVVMMTTSGSLVNEARSVLFPRLHPARLVCRCAVR